MLLQVMFFPFFLIAIGGIISLAAIADPHHKRSAPRVGFPILCAGVFSAVLSFGLEGLVEALASIEAWGFICGYITGMSGGAFLGYRLALRHKRHLINSPSEVDHGNDFDDD